MFFFNPITLPKTNELKHWHVGGEYALCERVCINGSVKVCF